MSSSDKKLSQQGFLKTLPQALIPLLPEALRVVQIRQPWRFIIQFHFGEPWLHYEVSRVRPRGGYEIGFHCESRDKELNRYLLYGFRQHLFEIKDELGENIEAEMWDRGWTKIYEVVAEEDLTASYQNKIASRLAEFMTYMQPIYAELRDQVSRSYR
jgi:hypothetical protein